MGKSNLKYPIGIQSFRHMIGDGYAYVDKTADIFELINENKYCFMSRPRRFGKSLLISTLEEYFKGNRELFKGLAIDSLEPEPWQEHAVFHFDLNSQIYNAENSLEELLDRQLTRIETSYGITDANASVSIRFEDLIHAGYEKTGRPVAILIDEYDKPMLDVLGDENLEKINRSILRGFYGVMKSNDVRIRFAMLTGVGKLGNINVFSGLNNIRDISLNPKYASICGISEQEMHDNFHTGVETMALKKGWSVDETYMRLKKKYDGYHFSTELKDVYNPFSLINALADGELYDYWYETGTPTHLLKLLDKKDIRPSELKHYHCSPSDLRSGDITADDVMINLYYTGYLTIKEFDSEMDEVALGFPNEEVRIGFIRNLLSYLANCNPSEPANLARKLTKAIRTDNLNEFMHLLKSFFASIPYHIGSRNEAHYQDVIFCLCSLIGTQVHAEMPQSQGRPDLIIENAATIYIFEFKLDKTAEEALKQIDDGHYALPYNNCGKRIIKVGVNFSSVTRTLTDDWQTS